MGIVFLYMGWFLIPLLAIMFCINLVEILKKIKKDQPTFINTIWMTTSFVLITWTIAVIATFGVY
ncbi:hypothetical protein [Planococcus sp. YIM B11945]|uniref:hypothetical protein n=1 Tax=Planococcus sp. YIM B11945 TaxID=3435410 RepID=UPI003D7D9E81